MHHIPLWLSCWQSVDSLLNLAANAAIVLPFMAAICLILFARSRQREGFAHAAGLCLLLALIFTGFAFVDTLLRGIVDLKIIPATMPNMVPLPFDPFAPAWLQTTITCGLEACALFLLCFCRNVGQSVFTAGALKMDGPTLEKLSRQAQLAAVIAIIATLCLFASLISRPWPFLGLPDQMTENRAFMILLANAWHQTCADFMPAGGIAVLAFYLVVRPEAALVAETEQPAEEKKKYTAKELEERFPLPAGHVTFLRLLTAFAIAGAAFHFLNASFMAFSRSAGMGMQSALMQYGPFFCVGLSITCWLFLFVRPRRTGLTLALIPVLFMVARAILRF